MFARRLNAALKVFVHVPKTAGSTVNAHLKGWQRGQDHVEQFRDRPGALTRKLSGLHWISGHPALNKMQALVADQPRAVEVYGLIREPVAQVASQYNWLMEIGHRGGRFLRGHPQGIQDFSARLWASDNTDPQVVIDNMNASRGMFLNLQSRFLLGDDLKFSENSGADRLEHYTALCTDPADLVTRMTGAAPQETKRENASPYHFDRQVFDSPEVQTFLRRNHGHDLQLYARISARA